MERESERGENEREREREQRHRPESTDKRMPPMPHHHATRGTSQAVPDMMSASVGGGGLWKRGHSKGGCVNFIE